MKHFLCILLILCLLLPAALAETAGEAEPRLPEVGDVVHGFELVETRDYPLIDAVALRFEHRKTGAQLFYIANDDTNRAFNLAFFTEAIDNTGLPHVFEHATIQGSKKYPGEQMFFNTSYQTYNTYINAHTAQHFTCYPLASLSEAQLLKLAEYYTDACFYPIIMENEHIFRTEAWRYRLEKPEDPLTLEGTVYSEMLGVMTLKNQANLNMMRAAFPGSLAGNESGGLPEDIPDMTWQALKDYHDRYYHPSNCAAYLYGKFDDYGAFLKLLDDYFSQFERREFVREDPDYTPITAPVVETLPFPVEQGSNTVHASEAWYAFVCPGLRQDLQQELVLDTLTDLMSNSGSDFQQRLRQALPYASCTVSISMKGPEDAIVFNVMNIDPGDVETFRSIVDESLADVAQNGFPQALVDSVASTLEISAKLIRETSAPSQNILFPMVDRYSETGNPWDLIDYQESLFAIDDWNARGLYAQAAGDWLVDSQTTALVTTYPEPGAKEAAEAALAGKLAAIKAAMSDEEIAAIVEATNAPAPEDHSAEYVAQLKAVTVDSLPEEIQHYDVTDVTDDQGIRHIEAPAAVDGVSQVNIFLDAAGISQEDIHWVKLYTDLIGELDTTAHTRAELANLKNRYLNNDSVRLALLMEGEDGFHPYLGMSWIALDQDLAAGYDLMRELVYDTRMDDAQKLLEQVQAFKATMKASITASPATVLLRRALARVLPLHAYESYAGGLEYYGFLDEAERLLREDPEAAMAKLRGIREAFNNRANAVTLCAGSTESIALNRGLSDAFLSKLDAREIVPAEYDFPVPAGREAMIIDSGVQFNLLAADLAAAGLEAFDGSLNAVNSLIADAFMVPLLRDQYGVYTPIAYAEEQFLYFYTFRDPNIAETFDVLEQLPEFMRSMELDQETLDGYIMSTYSGYAMPEGALSGPLNAAMNVLQGLDPERKLTYMRQLKALTPDDVRADAEIYARFIENGARMTAGAASVIHQNADRFDAILNPFGAGEGK